MRRSSSRPYGVPSRSERRFFTTVTPRGAADLSGPRSAPRRPRHNCRSVARTLEKNLGPQDDEDDKRPADRTPAGPGPTQRNRSTRVEPRPPAGHGRQQTSCGRAAAHGLTAPDRTVPRILSSIFDAASASRHGDKVIEKQVVKSLEKARQLAPQDPAVIQAWQKFSRGL
jgi:hypothetical protein